MSRRSRSDPAAAAPDGPRACSLKRRLACMFYDLLLVCAVLFVAAAMALPFNGGEAVSGHSLLFRLWLFGITLVYFIYQWTLGGQTLGMRAWHVTLVSRTSQRVRWSQAVLRFLLALISALPLGLGYLAALFDADGLTWHDRGSGTRLVVTARRER